MLPLKAPILNLNHKQAPMYERIQRHSREYGRRRGVKALLCAVLCMLGVSSCTMVTTGFWLDEIGCLRPEEHDRGQPRRVYRGTDAMYVQIPVVQVQHSESVIRHVDCTDLRPGVGVHRYPQLSVQSVSEPENYILRIPSVVGAPPLGEWDASLPVPPEEMCLLSASAVELSACERMPDACVELHPRWPEEWLGTRRSLGNQFRMPLARCCMLADIPLSLIATPIGWVTDVFSSMLGAEDEPSR